MGTKTAAETAAEPKIEDKKADLAGSAPTEDTAAAPAAEPATTPAPAAEETAAADADAVDAADPAGDGGQAPSPVGQGAGAVVAAALGVVSLSGGWLGTVASAREQLIGQLRTSTSASVATQIKEVYGDAWHTTALWAGVFALAAVIVGVVVLARPAFGAARAPQTPWIKSVAWAGVVLGVVGLLLAVLKYTDALLALPSA
ncbi:hypothetical protein [Streptomyces similanensis]|uniref:Integral membrane protein n=1 Tax=Streptomyces similanensis TaxID=1274988 RepID=A0ABP9K3C6_9ACTN